MYDQNPLTTFSREMAREFENNRGEFLRKLEEFVMKYASPKYEDLQLLFEPKSNEIKEQILNKENIELKEKLKILEEENFLMKRKLIKEEKFQNNFDNLKNDNSNQFSFKILELIQEIKELKSK